MDTISIFNTPMEVKTSSVGISYHPVVERWWYIIYFKVLKTYVVYQTPEMEYGCDAEVVAEYNDLVDVVEYALC